MKMETIERIEHMVCEQLDKAQPDWVQSASKAEYLRTLVSINQKLMCLKDDAEGCDAYRMGYGGSYRRGRDSMGRYTSYRSYGADMGYGMPYERGYSAADKAKVDDLCRELEFLQTRVGGAERDTIQSAIAELKSK